MNNRRAKPDWWQRHPSEQPLRPALCWPLCIGALVRGARRSVAPPSPVLRPRAGKMNSHTKHIEILYGKYVIQNLCFVWLPAPRSRARCCLACRVPVRRALARPARRAPRPPGGWRARARSPLRWVGFRLAGVAASPPRASRGGSTPPPSCQGQDKRACGAALTCRWLRAECKQGQIAGGASPPKSMGGAKNDRRCENPRNLRRMPLF